MLNKKQTYRLLSSTIYMGAWNVLFFGIGLCQGEFFEMECGKMRLQVAVVALYEVTEPA